MRLVDLTHSLVRRSRIPDVVPVAVKASKHIPSLSLDRLVTLATVLDLTDRPNPRVIDRLDISVFGLADVDGCILRTGWCDGYLAGEAVPPPVLSVDAAALILGSGVRTVAADFPIMGAAEDMLLHNHCVLVRSLSGLHNLTKPIVRLVALPLKIEDAYCADARVIAIEE